MKIIYKKPIHKQLDEAIIEAKLINRKIEKFILTQEEYDELNAYTIEVLESTGMYYVLGEPKEITKYDGIPVEKEELPTLIPAIRKNTISGMTNKESCPNGYR